MSNRPTKLIIDLSKPKGQQETIVEYTDEELAQREAENALFEQQQKAEQEALDQQEADKQSAKDKLAELGLTEAQIAALMGA